MKRLTSYLCAAAMAVSTIGLGTAGANAQPIPTPTQFQGQFGNSNVIEVQRRDARQRPPSARGGFERRGGSAYYRGHRGQRQARQGWRQHQGWWFPPAAFVAGAIIGGAVAQQPRPAPEPRSAASAGRMSSGATASIAPTAHPTTRSSPTRVRVARAGRPSADPRAPDAFRQRAASLPPVRLAQASHKLRGQLYLIFHLRWP